jgi:hypothetical protein
MVLHPRLLALSLLLVACATRGGPTPSTPPIAKTPSAATEPSDAKAPSEPAEPGDAKTPSEPGDAKTPSEPAEPTPPDPSVRGPLTEAQVAILFGTAEDEAPEHRGGVTAERQDKHYLAGNERTLQAYYPVIKDVGGGYVGVGTDQAYLFMSWARPEIAWLVDYDPAVVEVHELYRLFFEAAATPEEFVALWDKPKREEALAIIDAAHDDRKFKTLRRWYLGYKGWIFKRLTAVTRTMQKSEVPSYLTDQEHYDFVKQMLAQKRVRPMVVNLLERKGLEGVSQASKELGVPIRLLYLSNAEEYWPRYPKAYRETMATLPFHEQALVLRTLLIWQVNTDYRYNVQPAKSYVEWLAQPYIDDVYDITHDRPKAQAEGINFFETAGDPTQSPSARRWRKAQAEPAS